MQSIADFSILDQYGFARPFHPLVFCSDLVLDIIAFADFQGCPLVRKNFFTLIDIFRIENTS